jgi:uncharacterized membrane protein
MQMKMLERMDEVKSVYYVIFRVSQLVVSNYGKKSVNTNHSLEVSLSTLLQAGEADEQDALERLSSESVVDNARDATDKEIDLVNARRRMNKKLETHGWPADIQRMRTRLGRPLKQQPLAA